MNRILAILAVIGGVLAAVFKVKNETLQRKSAEREADIAKESEKATSKAAEALVKGVADEAKSSGRGHFNSK